MSRTTGVLIGIIMVLAIALAYFIGASRNMPQPEPSTNDSAAEAPAPASTEVDDGQSHSAVSVAPVGGASRGFTADETRLIKKAASAWSAFRNGDEGAEATHTAALDTLLRRNICWGKVGQSQAEYDYHRCVSASIQKQPEPAKGSDAELCNEGDHDACMRL